LGAVGVNRTSILESLLEVAGNQRAI